MEGPTFRALQRERHRSIHARRADEAQTSSVVVPATEEGYEQWSASPGETDFPYVDTGPEYGRTNDEDISETMARQASIHHLTDHHLDPVTSIWDIAYLAGYGSGGYDTFQGVDDMVLGHVDAMHELDVGKGPSDANHPLSLAPEESIFADDLMFGDMGAYRHPDDDRFDWTGWL